jgi:hypothetical protein
MDFQQIDNALSDAGFFVKHEAAAVELPRRYQAHASALRRVARDGVNAGLLIVTNSNYKLDN